MGRKTDTKEKILKAATDEFFEKGYDWASLREICKRAGTTTGSFYFFFKDKEELFSEIVKPLEEFIENVLSNSHKEKLEAAESKTTDAPSIDDFISAYTEALKFFMRYEKESLLFFDKSRKGYKENVVKKVVDSYAEVSLPVLENFKSYRNIDPKININSIRLYLDCFFTGFVNLIISDLSKEEKENQILVFSKMMHASWKALFSEDDFYE